MAVTTFSAKGTAWVQPGGFGMRLRVPEWFARATIVISSKRKWIFFASELLLMREERVSPPWRVYRWPWRFQRDRDFSYDVYNSLDGLGLLDLLVREHADTNFVVRRSIVRCNGHLNATPHTHSRLIDELRELFVNVEGFDNVQDTLMRAGFLLP